MSVMLRKRSDTSLCHDGRMKMILTIIADAVAIWVAAYLISGIEIGGEGTSFWLTLLAVAVIFGVLNAVVKPILKLLSLPLIVLTLGLFLFVLNAIMLSLTSWLAGVLGLDFTVESFFWDAVLGAIIVSAVSLVVDMLLPDGKER
ncbi:hypothetical protein GCM10011509_29090 [Ornithinimicrobium pekingense]|uniref:Phage holin family protein n=2 Tax=Ornithinimicrobium pekingense TaxID=384677 RepID=A0ABQ2FDM9_9MICO|nr:hypothetical protein GCM10011509_29090 [Ornithinimicrobium pekingense]